MFAYDFTVWKFCDKIKGGRVAEWFKAPVLKTGRLTPRRFESSPFRHACPEGAHGNFFWDWRSLVARTHGVREVRSSNLLSQTNQMSIIYPLMLGTKPLLSGAFFEEDNYTNVKAVFIFGY